MASDCRADRRATVKNQNNGFRDFNRSSNLLVEPGYENIVAPRGRISKESPFPAHDYYLHRVDVKKGHRRSRSDGKSRRGRWWPLTRLHQQAGARRQSVADRRRLVFRRERRHAEDHGAAGGRPGHQRQLGGTMLSGVQFVSVRVMVTVQPRDRGYREQDERRQRQMDNGHPKQRRVGAAGREKKIRTYYQELNCTTSKQECRRSRSLGFQEI